MMTNLSLRALEMDDLDVLFEVENDTQQWKYTDRSHPYTKAFLMEYILQSHLTVQEAGQLRLALSNSQNTALGFVDLFDVDLHHQRAGIGIAIRSDNQNQGLGSTALSLLLDYCRSHLSLHQLYCDIDVSNTASIRLFENAGFIQKGEKQDWNFYNQSYHSVYFYQKLLNP